MFLFKVFVKLSGVTEGYNCPPQAENFFDVFWRNNLGKRLPTILSLQNKLNSARKVLTILMYEMRTPDPQTFPIVKRVLIRVGGLFKGRGLFSDIL